ncbi:uncharacterized protein LOC134237029 [Saccostrea cucullata]|uniref:uncharacterized protein LOC134237029 n=1 Tax=Saccostrea cuccullata TaxID=36930 RepID=UPI002ED17FF6
MTSLNQFGFGKKLSNPRKRTKYTYTFQEQTICRKAFEFIYDVKEYTLDSLQKHLQSQGITPRVHGNKGRKAPNAFKFEEVKNAVQYLINYASQHGIPQPAGTRGRDTEPTIFLPCSDTKDALHKRYVESCAQSNIRALGLSTFKDVWLRCIPHIKISTPRTDVCHICERHRNAIRLAVGDVEKLRCTTAFQDHLQRAAKEKQAYQQAVMESMTEIENVRRGYGPSIPCSSPYTKVHYTFDFSQQMFIPHHARQMGPLYFLVPRKVQLFGVRVDGVPRQYNYLINENETIGENGSKTHGPNAVISMLHHALLNFGFGEINCVIHADNCAGQNKNRYVLAYFCWRVLLGLHQQITFMMQIPGHARCLVDSSFAHIKRLYRRTDCNSIADLRNIVDKSCYSNNAVLFEEEETWMWLDWMEFFSSTFSPLKGLRDYQHFRFTQDRPGFVLCRKSNVDEEIPFKLLKCDPEFFDTNARPRTILPGGLTRERQKYLYQRIRPFVQDPWKDTTCPPVDIEE